jgi:hypothetical protein
MAIFAIPSTFLKESEPSYRISRGKVIFSAIKE